MAIFNLVLCKARADSYGPYVGYLVCFLAFQMNVNGTLFQWVIQIHPSLCLSYLSLAFLEQLHSGRSSFGGLILVRLKRYAVVSGLYLDLLVFWTLHNRTSCFRTVSRQRLRR